MYPTTAQWDDRDLARRIVEFFQARQLVDSTAIQIHALGGVIVLRGQVSSERERTLYVQCCQHVAGVVRVVDQLQVREEDEAAVAIAAPPRIEKTHVVALNRSSLCLQTT